MCGHRAGFFFLFIFFWPFFDDGRRKVVVVFCHFFLSDVSLTSSTLVVLFFVSCHFKEPFYFRFFFLMMFLRFHLLFVLHITASDPSNAFVFRCDYASVCPSVRPVLFSNDEKRHVPCSDDNEISNGRRESRGQFKSDIRMSVRQSVCPSDTKRK